MIQTDPKTWYGGGWACSRSEMAIARSQLFPLRQVRLGTDSGGARQVRDRSRAHRHHTQVGVLFENVEKVNLC